MDATRNTAVAWQSRRPRRPLAWMAAGLLALVLAVGPMGVRAAFAQDGAAAGERSITVIGFGEASVAAETVVLQMLLSAGDPFGGPPPRPRAGETPGEEERAAAAPVVDALVAEGVVEDDIQLLTSPAFPSNYGPAGGTGVVLLEARVAAPTIEDLNNLVDVAFQAATEQDLFVQQQIGARYEVADCAPLRREARQAAIEDARAQAEVQAELMGVTLGEPLRASDMVQAPATSFSSYFGIVPAAGACDPLGDALGAAFGVTGPPLDPTGEAEVEVYAQVSMTFAIEA